jgi:hypothetical protein
MIIAKLSFNATQENHNPPPLAIIDRGCNDSNCARHLSKIEASNAQLARYADVLRRENDALRRQLQDRRAAA